MTEKDTRCLDCGRIQSNINRADHFGNHFCSTCDQRGKNELERCIIDYSDAVKNWGYGSPDDVDNAMSKIKEYVSNILKQAVEEERKRSAEVIKKEKETWANQSIGWKAVESVEKAITPSNL